MEEALTLVGLGGAIITGGITFLYGQAGELLKGWRERRAKRAELSAQDQASTTIPDALILPDVAFDGQLTDPVIHLGELDLAAEQLASLRQDLMPYIEGLEEIDPENMELLKRADALRNLLEAIYQQRITLKNEQRPALGAIVESRIDVNRVVGDAAAVRIHEMRAGAVKVEATADVVEQGGVLTGVVINRLG